MVAKVPGTGGWMYSHTHTESKTEREDPYSLVPVCSHIHTHCKHLHDGPDIPVFARSLQVLPTMFEEYITEQDLGFRLWALGFYKTTKIE